MAVNIGPQLQELLSRYGLASLAEWLSQRITAGASPQQVEIEMYDRPEFITRFPAIRIRGREGLPPLTVEEYLSYENIASQLGRMWDISLSKEEVDNLLALNVSPVELEDRFGLQARVLYETPFEDRLEFMRLYNVSEGRLIKYWMDPKKEFGKLQQEYTAARIAGAAVRSRFGELSLPQAERLASVGMTAEQASQGFQQLYGMRELFVPLDETEELITLETQVESLAGSAEATEQIQKRQARRVAEFGGGGEFAAGGEGFKGVGTSTP